MMSERLVYMTPHGVLLDDIIANDHTIQTTTIKINHEWKRYKERRHKYGFKGYQPQVEQLENDYPSFGSTWVHHSPPLNLKWVWNVSRFAAGIIYFHR